MNALHLFGITSMLWLCDLTADDIIVPRYPERFNHTSLKKEEQQIICFGFAHTAWRVSNRLKAISQYDYLL